MDLAQLVSTVRNIKISFAYQVVLAWLLCWVLQKNLSAKLKKEDQWGISHLFGLEESKILLMISWDQTSYMQDFIKMTKAYLAHSAMFLEDKFNKNL